jgi:two-component system phosphate regulon sensor histidine kinase PhoR
MNEETVPILVVDDERGMREGCRKILTAEGYEVVTAEDGMAGLEVFKRQPGFAVALVDLKMPRMGGIQFIEQVRERDEDVVLLVITAYATIDTAVEATKRGADGYIPKPFTPDELVSAVRTNIDKRALTIEARRLREEREKRLLELAFERSKSSTIINCMIDGVLVVNSDKQIVLRNAAAARLVPECANLPPIAAPLDALECAPLREFLGGVLDAGSEPAIVSKEIGLGKSVYMVNASPVVEPNGETLGAVAVLRDITALKRLELAKSMFVSMVAHEVKNPLAAIEGYLNVILSGVAGEDPVRDRDMMRRALVRAGTLRTMISELMSLTAMETGNFVIRRSPLDVDEVVAEAVTSCQEKAAEKEIEVCVNSDQAGERVLADRAAMLRVFTNIVDNAIKYTPEKGHVDVRLEHNNAYVRVMVRDDGIGMRQEDVDRVFEEFFRAKNEYTARVPGTGLGLSLVKRLVDMHQGNVTLESSPGKGSTVTVVLPVLDGARAS